MSLLKCKMCGGDLEISEGTTVAECEYCGTKQTVPKNVDENLQNLFNRANVLRIKCEFDKAERMYEKIVVADETQSDAYWGLILCKYGIEYVDDPQTLKKIPTCHRASYDSIIADDNYKMAIEYADDEQRVIYEEQAREIDRIQNDILALAQKEEVYDVFICYKETDANGQRTVDSVIANDIYHQLTQEGMRVFYAAITLEGKLGSAYEPIIFAALNSAKVMLTVGTKPEYFNAVWVKNEWSRFLKIIEKDRTKLLIPCYRDMDAYELPDEFAHLQAQDMSKIGFISDIVRGIKKVAKKDEPKPEVAVEAKKDSSMTQLVLEDGTLYEGETFANIPHGHGRAEYTSGLVYEGEWNRGKYSGKGKFIYPDGDTWEGEFKDNEPKTGYGKILYDKAYYVGNIQNGNRIGNGKFVYSNGDVYEGEFKDGYVINGRYVYKNGDVYVGEFKGRKREGHGVITYTNGDTWEGIFKFDMPWNGKGRIAIDNGSYIGDIINGKREGYGKFVYANGNTYEGEYKANLRNGHGILTYTDGEVWEGEFVNDRPWTGSGKTLYNMGCYIGKIVNGKREGYGKYFWRAGGSWEGEFRDNLCWTGEGVIWHDDGTSYEGKLVRGKRKKGLFS